HGKQGGFARAIGADDRGDPPLGQLQGNPVHHAGGAVILGDIGGDDHRADLRRTRAMKTMPPRNSMMIERAVSKAKTRSNRVCPPTSATMASRIAAGST